MSVKDRIRQAMKEAGFTQRTLADALGISNPTVNSFINKKDKRTPTVTTVKKIAAATGKPLNYFFEEDVPTFALPKSETKKDHTPTAVGVGHDGEILFIGQPPSQEAAMQKKQDSIEIKDDSFCPHFTQGQTVVWDYTLPPKTGIYVVVELENKKYTFGKMKGAELTDLHGKPLHGKILASVIYSTIKKVLY